MTRVYAAADLTSAYLLRDLLAHAGIRAQVFNENAQGGLGEIPFLNASPELWVEEAADFDRARALIEAHEQAPQHRGSVYCRRCAEENPANFQLCWNCAAEL